MEGREYSKPFMYYAVGEYGAKTHRPHYHAIVFNCNIETLLLEWRLGFRSQSKFTPARARYVTNYVINKENYGKRKKHAPFAIMSKGIGKSYLSDALRDYHRNRFDSCITFNGGEKHSIPRYLHQKIHRCETKISLIGEKNRQQAQREERIKNYGDEINSRNTKREIYNRSKKTLTNQI